MTPHSTPQPAATLAAFHEAGHCLGFLAHEEPFEYVTLFEDGGGLVAVDTWPTNPRIRALVSHCGPLAQARHWENVHRGPGPLWNDERDRYESQAYEEGGHRDLAIIRAALSALKLTDDPFRAQAGELVQSQWRAVERVAAALVKHRTLSYRAALRLAGDVR